jgi:hypothetical protein
MVHDDDDLDIPIWVDFDDGREATLFRGKEDSGIIELEPDPEPEALDGRIRVLEELLAQVRERKRARRR